MPTGTPPRRPPARPALACALARQGITRVDLAAAVGVSTFSIVRVIRGTMKPSLALMERIAAVLGDDDVEALFALDPALVRVCGSRPHGPCRARRPAVSPEPTSST